MNENSMSQPIVSLSINLKQREPQVDAGADVNFLDHFGQTFLVNPDRKSGRRKRDSGATKQVNAGAN